MDKAVKMHGLEWDDKDTSRPKLTGGDQTVIGNPQTATLVAALVANAKREVLLHSASVVGSRQIYRTLHQEPA